MIIPIANKENLITEVLGKRYIVGLLISLIKNKSVIV